MLRSLCARQRRPSVLLPVGGCFGVMGISSYSPSCANPVLNTSFRTRYGCIISFLNSRVSEQNWQLRAYIPAVDIGLIPRDMPMKWTLRHLSHIMPMWIGMAEITARTASSHAGVQGPARVVLCFGPPCATPGLLSFLMQCFRNCSDREHSGCVASFWRAYKSKNLLRENAKANLRCSYTASVLIVEVGRPYLARVAPSCQFP
jgi:hypothetical protein